MRHASRRRVSPACYLPLAPSDAPGAPRLGSARNEPVARQSPELGDDDSPSAGGCSARMFENLIIYSAVYDDVRAAVADLEAFEKLNGRELVDQYDAAVIDQHNGLPHLVRR